MSFLQGLIIVGFQLKAESQRRTPVDTSNLKASTFVTWSKTGGARNRTFKGPDAAQRQAEFEVAVTEARALLLDPLIRPTVFVGLSAAYALYVHEDMEVTHQNGEAKFLLNAMDMLSPTIRKTIIREGRKMRL